MMGELLCMKCSTAILPEGLHWTVSEETRVILSVLDNMQRILNCRAGTLAHLPDYGLPDMTKILQGMPWTAHELMSILSTVLLKYEPG